MMASPGGSHRPATVRADPVCSSGVLSDDCEAQARKYQGSSMIFLPAGTGGALESVTVLRDEPVAQHERTGRAQGISTVADEHLHDREHEQILPVLPALSIGGKGPAVTRLAPQLTQ